MIIFVGGLIGAGKSTIAKKVAAEFNFFYYDVDEVKKAVFAEDPDFERNMRDGIPFSDATREKLYDRVIEDLKELRVTHQYVVVDEALHKREFRHKMYRAAEEIYGDFIVIWVRANEKMILDRLQAVKREGHILNDPLPMHESFRRQFEDFNRSVIVCNNNGEPDDAVASLKRLISSSSNLLALNR